MSATTTAARPGTAGAGAFTSIGRLDALDWALPLVPRDRRGAARAVLAFRAEVQAVADGAAPRPEKRGRLAAWRLELDALEAGLPATPVTIALQQPLHRHRLPRTELENLVLAADMDAGGVMVAPPQCDLRLYTRRSGGALIILLAAVLGDTSHAAGCFGLALGEAMRLTTLLRDLGPAARAGRLCLPRESLAEAGIVAASTAEVLDHPALDAACAPVAATASERFADARLMLPEVALPARPFLRAVLEAHEDLLETLHARGRGAAVQPPPSPGRVALAARVLRHRFRGAA
ncbi:Squalene/phytoene synthase [Caenispirillum salinarum AK4]|uniref:Squalene/phytoene synthase n=1 Tax=Caenispirillum salinarum AK4 TaxID=1238182 RepID=K9HMP6_9PROT|nr:squalene/phytoene synthase family protein [Caenispirillum salinarum]EKV31578.1 Squalene/phytoene synthase [Caenispirillum salinarum AK4]